MSGAITFGSTKYPPWSVASTTVEKLQYYYGKTPVPPRWDWRHGRGHSLSPFKGQGARGKEQENRPLPNPSGLRRLRSPIAPLLTGNCPEGRLLPLPRERAGERLLIYNLTIYRPLPNLPEGRFPVAKLSPSGEMEVGLSLRRRRWG
jgi:hypothetical protein